MKWYFMFRRIKSLVFFLVMMAFLTSFLNRSGIDVTGEIKGGLNTAGNLLGINELGEVPTAIADAFDGIGQGKAKTSKAMIARVVDGDTFLVTLASGQQTYVRVLAIDSPEKNRPNYPIECGAYGASNAAHRIADGKTVKLTTDPTQDTVDMYGRLLRYAKIDGKDYGLTMLKKGWVAPYVFDNNPVQKIDAYRAAAELAKSTSRGVWGKCGGDFHSAGDEPWSGD